MDANRAFGLRKLQACEASQYILDISGTNVASIHGAFQKWAPFFARTLRKTKSRLDIVSK